MVVLRSLLPWLLALGTVTSSWQLGQDPAPAPPPATTIPGRPPRNALEGVYELKQRVTDSRAEAPPSRGYLAITSRHMLLCVVGPGTDPKLPLLRASVRGWQQDDDQLRSEVKLGYFTDAEGGIHVERPGTAEVRRVEVLRGRLRIYQAAHSYLEFERLE